MENPKTTIADLIMEYFRAHPKKDLEHGPVVDWVEEQYLLNYMVKSRETLGVAFGDYTRRAS